MDHQEACTLSLSNGKLMIEMFKYHDKELKKVAKLGENSNQIVFKKKENYMLGFASQLKIVDIRIANLS